MKNLIYILIKFETILNWPISFILKTSLQFLDSITLTTNVNTNIHLSIVSNYVLYWSSTPHIFRRSVRIGSNPHVVKFEIMKTFSTCCWVAEWNHSNLLLEGVNAGCFGKGLSIFSVLFSKKVQKRSAMVEHIIFW